MKILIAEDDNRIRRSLKRGLENERFLVDEAEDGERALIMLEADQYDLVILDWMMPETDGIEVCQIMRQKGISTPVIMLTAKGQIKDKVNGLDSGADDYLVKPFSFVELLARIRSLLRRPADFNNNILKLDDLEINTTNFEVKRAGKNIKLSKTEYTLLEYLIRNPNQVLSKEKIISSVWDFDADILPNTVEVFMGYLRTKIDKKFPNSAKLIHTVRGFGYKIGVQDEK